MQSSQLLRLLIAMKPNEWRGFEIFLYSRISSSSELARLYSYIKKHRKNPTSNKLELGRANKLLFKNKSRKNFSNLMSVLTGHFRNYFVHLQLEQKELLQNALLIEELNNRNLYDDATQVYRDTIKKEEKWQLGFMNNMYKQMIYHQLYYSYNPVKYSEEGPELLKASIEMNNENFVSFQNMNDLGLDNREFIKKTIDQKILTSQASKENKLSELILNIRDVAIDRDQDRFDELLAAFFSEYKTWDKMLQNLVFQMLKRYFLRAIKNGTISIYELVKFDKFCWNQSDLIGVPSISQALPLYEVAIFANDYGWAKIIYDTVKNGIGSSEDVNRLKILDGILFFSKDQIEKATHIFNTLSKLGTLEKNAVRVWLLLCNGEMCRDDKNYLISQHTNFNSYLNRIKGSISSPNWTSYHNFGKVWKNLFIDDDHNRATDILSKRIPISKRVYFAKKINEMAN